MKIEIQLFNVLLIVNSMFFGVNAASNNMQLRVIASGESHGMIDGCDCLNDPGGGMAQRAFMINTLGTRKDKLLLDVGGFAAGDMYDSYTEGRAADSLRTYAMINAMGIIKYDAVAIGDDDLQYGGKWLLRQADKAKLPLVSVNCFTKDGALLTSPYILVKKGKLTYGITALTSDEGLIQTGNDVDIKDPFNSLSLLWSKIVEKSDVQIILSHLGQENANKISQMFPECDLIVNGHRKSDNAPVFYAGAIPVMQFGFQGKSLSQSFFKVIGKKIELIRNDWIRIHENLPLDSTVVKVIQYNELPARSVYDLYLMSQCPYGIDALSDFLNFQKSFPSIEWNIWFIGTVKDNGELISLQGENEVHDEMLWLAVKELYPDKWVEFLSIRSKLSVPAAGLPSALNVDKKKIDQWIIENGKKVLSGHYRRSTRLKINASPTLLLNNLPYEGRILKNSLSKDACNQHGNISAYCDSVPVCIEDIDCKQKGMIGRCIADTCEFEMAVQFKFTVLVNDSIDRYPEEPIIQTTEELFPGAEISKISIHTNKGESLLKMWGYPALPFYFFEKDVKLSRNFSSIESGLIQFFDGFTFKPGITSHNFFPSREEAKGKIVFLIDPLFKGIPEALKLILNKPELVNKSFVSPIVFTPPQDVQPGTLEQFRHDEAFRWLAINNSVKHKMTSYLGSYMKNFGTSFWYENSKAADISNEVFSGISIEQKRKMLQDQHSFIRELEIKEPFAILLNNREIIYIGNESSLEKFLKDK